MATNPGAISETQARRADTRSKGCSRLTVGHIPVATSDTKRGHFELTPAVVCALALMPFNREVLPRHTRGGSDSESRVRRPPPRHTDRGLRLKIARIARRRRALRERQIAALAGGHVVASTPRSHGDLVGGIKPDAHHFERHAASGAPARTTLRVPMSVP